MSFHGEKMKIGIASPIDSVMLAPYFAEEALPLPKGMGATSVTLLVMALLAAGHEVIIYTLSRDIQEREVFAGGRLTLCFGRYRKRLRWPDFFRVESREVRDMILAYPAEIVHAHWTYEYALGTLNAGFPHVITVRDWAPLVLKRVPPWHYRFVRLLMNNRVFRRTDSFIANSAYMQELIRRRFGYDIPVIPNPMNPELRHIAKPPTDDGSLRIVSINNGFDRRKNTQTLLRAFSLIHDLLPDAGLYLLGGGYERGGVAEQWAEAHGCLNDGLHFLGAQNYLAAMQILAGATLMIHPSLEESFGNVLVEAMALKVPVIAGRKSGAVPWVLDDGRAGVLVDVVDPQAIAAAALELWREKGARQLQVERAFLSANRRFSPDLIAAEHIKLYRKIMERG